MTLILLLVAWLLTYLLHSTLLLGGAWLLERLGAVRSPAARDSLWKVALLGGLVTATAQLALRVEPRTARVSLSASAGSPFIDVAGEVPRRAPPAARATRVEPPSWDGASLTATPPVSAEPRRFRLAQGIHVSWPAMLLHLWLMGALALSIRLVALRAGLRRRLRLRRPVEGGPLLSTLAQLCAAAGLRRPVRVTLCDGLCGPIALGSSEICLPGRVRELEVAGQRAVLAHELGHLVRRDPAWLMAAAIIESVLFLQPFNRLARRRLQEVAEYLCDDWAAHRSDGVVLARCLAEVASWIQASPQLAPVAGMAENRSHLVARVQRLVEGRYGGRCAAWSVRLAAGAMAVAVVGWAAPGVAAEDLDAAGGEVAARGEAIGGGSDVEWKAAVAAAQAGEGWASLREGGRLIVLHPGWSARLTGQGRIGFRQWGRALVVPAGHRVIVDGDAVAGDREVCDEQTLRIVNAEGRTAWEIVPVPLHGAPAYTSHEADLDRLVEDAIRYVRVRRDSLGIRVEMKTAAHAHPALDVDTDLDANVDTDLDVHVDLDDAIIEARVSGALDTLLRAWAHDPEAVRVAARRIARAYERDLRPQFESLGVELGRELAPQLERLTTRLGRDLVPEFARLGAELGRTIVSVLEDADPEVDDGGAGAGDWRGKRKPKQR